MSLPRRTIRRRRRGQALIEFTVSFMVFFSIFLCILEMCRALNAAVTLNSIASAAAAVGADDDPLGEIDNATVEAAAMAQVTRFRVIDGNRVTVDVNRNYVSPGGTFHTRVAVNYAMPTVFVPVSLNGTGDWNLTVAVLRPNQVQAFRP